MTSSPDAAVHVRGDQLKRFAHIAVPWTEASLGATDFADVCTYYAHAIASRFAIKVVLLGSGKLCGLRCRALGQGAMMNHGVGIVNRASISYSTRQELQVCFLHKCSTCVFDFVRVLIDRECFQWWLISDV